MKVNRYSILTAFITLIVVTMALAIPVTAKKKKDKRSNRNSQQEDAENYFEKWLKEDALYIISEEEKDVFNVLATMDEKEQFIEQFWRRRDPDLRTANNEFKEEHYRRIAYANERFHSGSEGWKSDRGRVYIIHGEPAEIEAYPSGGDYERPYNEGGGTTTVYPLEIWRYRHIEGVGQDILLEFVDDTFTNTYRLALQPEEKDAMLHMPGGGLTRMEQLGLRQKMDRSYFRPGQHNSEFSGGWRNNPFYRYAIFSGVQKPQAIKYRDFQQKVKVNIGYANLPFRVRSDYFKLNDQQVLVPITVEIQNTDMMFEKDGEGKSARMGLYGAVTSLGKEFIQEFDHDLVVTFAPEKLEKGLQGRSMYQKILLLDNKTRYKLDLIIKDLSSNNIGATKQAIIPPASVKKSETLSSSSLILSDFIQQLGELPKYDEMFVLGDIWIRPSIDKSFSQKVPLGIYLHLYNFNLDQSSNTPELEVKYRIRRKGELIREDTDISGESIQFLSGDRLVLVKRLDLSDLEPGTYRIEVEAWDHLSDAKAQVEDNFRVKGD